MSGFFIDRVDRSRAQTVETLPERAYVLVPIEEGPGS